MRSRENVKSWQAGAVRKLIENGRLAVVAVVAEQLGLWSARVYQAVPPQVGPDHCRAAIESSTTTVLSTNTIATANPRSSRPQDAPHLPSCWSRIALPAAGSPRRSRRAIVEISLSSMRPPMAILRRRFHMSNADFPDVPFLASCYSCRILQGQRQ